jgi:hypothetical protein
MKLIEFSRLLNKLICISYILTGKLGKGDLGIESGTHGRGGKDRSSQVGKM